VLHDIENNLNTIERVNSKLLDKVDNLDELATFAQAFGRMKENVVDDALRLDLRHCLSEGPGVHAAHLVARQHWAEDGLYLTDIPLNLRASSRQSVELELVVEAPYLDGRKRSWGEIGRQQSIPIEDTDWQEMDGESLAFGASIVLRGVPLLRTRGDGARPARWPFLVRARDRRTGFDITREFTFEHVSFEPPTFETLMGDDTSAEEMLRHPLGIQRHYQEILDTIKSGIASFMVVAPRRFGKSTLLGAIATATRADDWKEILTIGPIRALPDEGMAGAFSQACQLLGHELNANVPTNWRQQDLLPAENAFDQATDAAWRQGKKTIYFLFDEAQAMFSQRHRGKDAAERLKARLESRWARSRPGHAAVRVGLVGQPHLFRLISGQLDAFFGGHIYRGAEIDADEIEKLLRERTQGVMQSTRDARRLLGVESRSLYVLKVMMQEVQQVLRKEQRTWFLRQDVEMAIEALIKDAVEVSHHTNRSYVRDPLNASDNLTEWRPTTAYPVAIAYAIAASEGITRRIARIERVRQLLDSWVSEFAGSARVPEIRISESVSELRDLEVLDAREEFMSQLLQRFLAQLGRDAVPLQEHEERRALQSLCVDLVKVPDVSDLVKLGKGGQAEVYLTKIDERDTALRVVEIPTERDRIAFVEMCAALRAIEGTRNRSRGYQSLPVTRKVGFTDEAASQGVVMYDFVPGNSLDDRIGSLPRIALLDVGRSVAEALAVLAQRGVVHRDVKPMNIVLGPDGVPVLVDFGLARLIERAPVTKFDDSKYTAPEVRNSPAHWSPAADVFALGMTLRELAEQATDQSLLDILRRATLEDVKARVSAEVLAQELDRIAASAQVDSQRRQGEERFAKMAAQISERWAAEIARKYCGEMVASSLGIFSTLQILCSAAQLLQDIFEAWYFARHQGGGPLQDKPYLSRLQPAQFTGTVLQNLAKKETVATGLLRHSNAHKRDLEGNIRKAKIAMNTSDESQLVYAVKETAVRVERMIRIDGIAALVDAWIASHTRRPTRR
jgi:hypothetical protein